MTLPEQTIRNMTAEELAVYAEASCDYSQDTMQAMQLSFDTTLEETQEELEEANENVERLEAALKIALNDLKKIRKLSDDWLEDERSIGEVSEKVMCRIDSIADGACGNFSAFNREGDMRIISRKMVDEFKPDPTEQRKQDFLNLWRSQGLDFAQDTLQDEITRSSWSVEDLFNYIEQHRERIVEIFEEK